MERDTNEISGPADAEWTSLDDDIFQVPREMADLSHQPQIRTSGPLYQLQQQLRRNRPEPQPDEAKASSRQAVTDESTIRSLSVSCAKLLEQLCDVVQDESHQSVRDRLIDERGRFRVWVAGIGALEDPSHPQSLEHKLNQRPSSMREGIIDGLHRLDETGNKIANILNGNEPNRSITTSQADAKLGRGTEDTIKHTTIELDTLLDALKSSMNFLFYILSLMTRALPERRHRNLDHLETLDSAPKSRLWGTIIGSASLKAEVLKLKESFFSRP